MDGDFDYKVTVVEDDIEPVDCLAQELKASKKHKASWRQEILLSYLFCLILSIGVGIFTPFGLCECLAISSFLYFKLSDV